MVYMCIIKYSSHKFKYSLPFSTLQIFWLFKIFCLHLYLVMFTFNFVFILGLYVPIIYKAINWKASLNRKTNFPLTYLWLPLTVPRLLHTEL